MSSNPLRQQAYDFIQEEIASGRLPAGSQLSELSLARQIGISRTPVREAIRRLVHEGLLDQVPRFGTIVRTPQRRDIVELYELREALEGFAAGQAAARITPEDLAVLDRLCQKIQQLGERLGRSRKPALTGEALEQFLSSDLAFHLLIVRAAGNGRLLQIVSESRMLPQVLGMKRQEHTAAVVAETYRYHQRILQALKKRDAAATQALLVEHIARSKQEALQAFDRLSQQDAMVLPLAVVAELERVSPEAGRQRQKRSR